MKKILFLHSQQSMVHRLWSEKAQQTAACYDLSVDIPAWDGDLNAPDWRAFLNGYDALLTTWGSPRCDAAMLGVSPRVQVIGHAAGSVTAVVDPAVYRSALRVCSANGLMAETVAEWALMMTLIAQRNLTAYAALRPGEHCTWNRRYDFPDLHSITVGIWGFGDVARELLSRFRPLNIGRILVYSRHASEEDIRLFGAERVGSFEELLASVDILHCLAGLTPENCGRLNQRHLSLLHDGAAVINCGRAHLADAAALRAEAAGGRLRLFLDVFEEEPLPNDSAWFCTPNVLLTPHAAAGSGRERYVPYILESFGKYFSSGVLPGEVTPARFRAMTVERCRPPDAGREGVKQLPAAEKWIPVLSGGSVQEERESVSSI